ncbi:MAG TPA: recombinase RecT, partial [Pirellulales bacterium]|nr:recombinase RecT [Pirellulales bacterium]
MIAVQMGAEVGLPPMASIQNVAVINGRPSIWGDAMLAICRQSELFVAPSFREELKEVEGRGLTGFCTVERRGDDKPITHSFSMQDAVKAKLLDKDTPWKTYPQRMLVMRARSWALRDAFPDLLRGMRATEEERDCVTVEGIVAPQTLDDLADKLAAPPLPKIPSPPPPPLPPATPPDTAIDRSQILDEFAAEFARLGKVRSEKQILAMWEKVLLCHVAGTINDADKAALAELANAAKVAAAG